VPAQLASRLQTQASMLEQQQFGRYRLLENLAGGGMATVSRAVVDGPHGFERQLVIKRIQRALVSPTFVHMLATEARLSARLHHPGIVQVYEFGAVDGEYYLAMELVDGIDLHRLKRLCTQQQQRIPLGIACFIVREVAAALAYAHALCDGQGRPLSIVHRDISPSNVMVSPLGAVKLLDFGIAKAADHIRTDQTPTQVGWLRGKINYVSPEQAQGAPMDARSDIFSLGIVFHELLTMQRLFGGSTAFETLRRIRDFDVLPPSRTAPDVPPDLDAIVVRMMARKPWERFANCDELVAALTPIVRRLEGDAAALTRFVADLGVRVRGPAADEVAPEPTPTLPTPIPPPLDDAPPSSLSAEMTAARSRSGVAALASSSSAASVERITRPSAQSLARSYDRLRAVWTLLSFAGAFAIGLGVGVVRKLPSSAPSQPAVVSPVAGPPVRAPRAAAAAAPAPNPMRALVAAAAPAPVVVARSAPALSPSPPAPPSPRTHPSRTRRRESIIIDPFQ
jgi:serine/threonine-protein kinase